MPLTQKPGSILRLIIDEASHVILQTGEHVSHLALASLSLSPYLHLLSVSTNPMLRLCVGTFGKIANFLAHETFGKSSVDLFQFSWQVNLRLCNISIYIVRKKESSSTFFYGNVTLVEACTLLAHCKENTTC